jgi:hypothetical protein
MSEMKGVRPYAWRLPVLMLSLMHLFSNIAQTYAETDAFSESITRREASYFVVWLMVSLSPIPALFWFRRNCILLGVMAVPIIAIFSGRCYFLNTRPLIQNGDWAIWLNSLFGMISVVVNAAWIAAVLGSELINPCASTIR